MTFQCFEIRHHCVVEVRFIRSDLNEKVSKAMGLTNAKVQSQSNLHFSSPQCQQIVEMQMSMHENESMRGEEKRPRESNHLLTMMDEFYAREERERER